MKNIILMLSLLFWFEISHAKVEEEMRCNPGTSGPTDIKFTEVTFRMSWIGNMMQGYYAGSMTLKGEAFENRQETIDAKGSPHFHEFNFWGDGAARYIVNTYSKIDDKIGTSYIGTLTLRNKEGWEKSTQVICTKTL